MLFAVCLLLFFNFFFFLLSFVVRCVLSVGCSFLFVVACCCLGVVCCLLLITVNVYCWLFVVCYIRFFLIYMFVGFRVSFVDCCLLSVLWLIVAVVCCVLSLCVLSLGVV